MMRLDMAEIAVELDKRWHELVALRVRALEHDADEAVVNSLARACDEIHAAVHKLLSGT